MSSPSAAGILAWLMLFRKWHQSLLVACEGMCYTVAHKEIITHIAVGGAWHEVVRRIGKRARNTGRMSSG